jgi:hypothetical protein
MSNIKKITSITTHTTGEGTRLSATYSEISENGQLVKSNERFNVIVVDQEVQGHIDALDLFLQNKIPQ